MSDRRFYELRDSLRVLRRLVPELSSLLALSEDAPGWLARLEHNVLPALDFDLPVLLVAICGGGSTGKSTLFNTLAGKSLSQVAFRAGLTSRILLVGHPTVLGSAEVVEALLHRLPEKPAPWHSAADATLPGPPLYATVEQMPRTLLLIDTPDFDTGEDGQLVNRQRAEPVLRTAEVILYTFTNAVYNNLSNTQFMADVVGGIGGRPTVLIYRISRAASDQDVLDHSRLVASRLFGGRPNGAHGFPPEIIGVYRVHESDAVALGQRAPEPLPVGGVTRLGLAELLTGLDAGAIKRHVFAADLRAIGAEGRVTLAALQNEAAAADLYREALQVAMAQEALKALSAFPMGEALQLVTELFVQSSPAAVRALRASGRAVAAPMRGLRALSRRVIALWNKAEGLTERADSREALSGDLLIGANELRNRLLDDSLVVRVTTGDPLAQRVRDIASQRSPGGASLELLGAGECNVHVPVPRLVRELERELLTQDWEAIARTLSEHVGELVGLPEDLASELGEAVAAFRRSMSWSQRLRELFSASLSTLPPLLGVSYMLLTADPVSGTGLWIQLESIFGLNDLWALVSIPASVGLSERDRRQLEQMIQPVFQMWLAQRVARIVGLYAGTVGQVVTRVLARAPRPVDERFTEIGRALDRLQERR